MYTVSRLIPLHGIQGNQCSKLHWNWQFYPRIGQKKLGKKQIYLYLWETWENFFGKGNTPRNCRKLPIKVVFRALQLFTKPKYLLKTKSYVSGPEALNTFYLWKFGMMFTGGLFHWKKQVIIPAGRWVSEGLWENAVRSRKAYFPGSSWCISQVQASKSLSVIQGYRCRSKRIGAAAGSVIVEVTESDLLEQIW